MHHLATLLQKYQSLYGPVVPFAPRHQKIKKLDLSRSNAALTQAVYTNYDQFSGFISDQLATAGAVYGIGGYLENRDVYSQSAVFNVTGPHSGNNSARSLHLGIDIWGPEGTPIKAPWGGSVHSFAFNNQPGDYGATIVLQHQLEGTTFYTLYGHLSLADLNIGQTHYISIGQTFAHMGSAADNGGWPPHLHFQIIGDMEGKYGDYLGVCSPEQAAHYTDNCPNPDLILNLMQKAI